MCSHNTRTWRTGTYWHEIAVSLLKNVMDAKMSLWMKFYRHWLGQTEEQWPETSCDRHWGDTCNIWNVWKQSQLTGGWTQSVLPRTFLNNPAYWGSFLEHEKRSPSVLLLPLLFQKLLRGDTCPWDLQAWAAFTAFLTALRSQSWNCSFSLLADKWVKGNALILLNHKALATLLQIRYFYSRGKHKETAYSTMPAYWWKLPEYSLQTDCGAIKAKICFNKYNVSVL